MSYGNDSDFQSYLDTYGYELPLDAPTPAVLRARGSAYIDGTYGPLWSGAPVAYPDLWPRTGAVLYCTTAVPSDAVPGAVIDAAYRAAYLEATTPGVLAGPVQSGPRVKRQKVDVIEREFFDDGASGAGSASGFIDPTIDGAMRAFICNAYDTPFIFESLGSSCLGTY